MSSTVGGRILVTGGAGYNGSILVPELVEDGYEVTVLDSFWFDQDPDQHPVAHVTRIREDIRNHSSVTRVLENGGFEAVIHLAAISNDPCSDLDESVTRDVNLAATAHLMTESKRSGVRRFLYASSASVYGVREEPDVTEDLELAPITVYAECKAKGEDALNALVDDTFVGVSVRAATVCGYSPRLRLDLTVNILTDHALRNGRIRVFGGDQMRPNVHIKDLTRFYRELLRAPADRVAGEAFNVCHENATVFEIANLVRDDANRDAEIVREPSNDPRSYHLCARKIERVLGFKTKCGIADAARELKDAYEEGLVPDPDSPRYRNVRWMLENRPIWSSPT